MIASQSLDGSKAGGKAIWQALHSARHTSLGSRSCQGSSFAKDREGANTEAKASRMKRILVRREAMNFLDIVVNRAFRKGNADYKTACVKKMPRKAGQEITTDWAALIFLAAAIAPCSRRALRGRRWHKA